MNTLNIIYYVLFVQFLVMGVLIFYVVMINSNLTFVITENLVRQDQILQVLNITDKNIILDGFQTDKIHNLEEMIKNSKPILVNPLTSNAGNIWTPVTNVFDDYKIWNQTMNDWNCPKGYYVVFNHLRTEYACDVEPILSFSGDWN